MMVRINGYYFEENSPHRILMNFKVPDELGSDEEIFEFLHRAFKISDWPNYLFTFNRLEE